MKDAPQFGVGRKRRGLRVAQVQSPTAMPGDAGLSHPCAIAEGPAGRFFVRNSIENDGQLVSNRFTHGLLPGFTKSGWWFGTFFFHNIFQRGGAQPPTRSDHHQSPLPPLPFPGPDEAH